MVSNISFMSLKIKNLSWKDNLPSILLIVIAALAIFFFQWTAIPITFMAYLLLSLLPKKSAA